MQCTFSVCVRWWWDSLQCVLQSPWTVRRCCSCCIPQAVRVNPRASCTHRPVTCSTLPSHIRCVSVLLRSHRSCHTHKHTQLILICWFGLTFDWYIYIYIYIYDIIWCVAVWFVCCCSVCLTTHLEMCLAVLLTSVGLRVTVMWCMDPCVTEPHLFYLRAHLCTQIQVNIKRNDQY